MSNKENSMKKLLLNLLISAAILVPGAAQAQPTQAKNVTGTWMFWGVLPGQTQASYVGTAEFQANGTLSGSGGTMGRWVRTGNQEFAFTFLANTSDSSGNYTGTHRVRGMMTLGDDASCTGKTLLEILDPTGTVIFKSPGPTTFTGVKLEVTPF
jgi:hypothetical protein